MPTKLIQIRKRNLNGYLKDDLKLKEMIQIDCLFETHSQKQKTIIRTMSLDNENK